jgi:hypothetical protein
MGRLRPPGPCAPSDPGQRASGDRMTERSPRDSLLVDNQRGCWYPDRRRFGSRECSAFSLLLKLQLLRRLTGSLWPAPPVHAAADLVLLQCWLGYAWRFPLSHPSPGSSPHIPSAGIALLGREFVHFVPRKPWLEVRDEASIQLGSGRHAPKNRKGGEKDFTGVHHPACRFNLVQRNFLAGFYSASDF